ncbi:SpoIIE family protein phosphatase, partial [Azospirillum thiophilum]
LRHSNEQLAVVNRQVMDSIQYASLLQSAILPDERAMARRLDGLCVLWRPRDVVGGDFHIFREFDDGRFLIGVADCSGHGVPGAFMTMTVSAILDHVLSETPDSDPAAILGRLNRMVRAALARGRDNPRFDNGLDIGLCLVRPDRGDLLFAGGRIGLHIVETAAGSGSVGEVKGDAQSLGYRRSDIGHRFTTHRVDLAPGRSFYLTTDGFLDQAGGARGFGFGNRRFNAMLLAHAAVPMADRKAAFAAALAEHQGDRPQRDDITLVGFTVAPARSPAHSATVSAAECATDSGGAESPFRPIHP